MSGGPSSSNTSISFEGLEGSSLTIGGSGFATNACQNMVRIGSEGHICAISSSTATSISCTVNGNPGGEIAPMESLNNMAISINVLNQGEAIFNVPNPDMVKFQLYPKISSSNIAEGSWAGGSLFVLTGSGLIPRGGKEAVLVIFGEEGSQKSCAIVDIAYDYISCLVPDFTASQDELTVPISLQMGYSSQVPEMAAALTFTFKSSLISTADSMSPTTVQGATDITITGTKLGSSTTNIQVFAQSVTVSGRRRRRSLEPEEKEDEEEDEEEMHKWWKQPGIKFGKDKKPVFRCLHGDECKYDKVTANVEVQNQERTKRSVGETEWLLEQEAEDDELTTFAICESEVEDPDEPLECMLRLAQISGLEELSSR